VSEEAEPPHCFTCPDGVTVEIEENGDCRFSGEGSGVISVYRGTGGKWVAAVSDEERRLGAGLRVANQCRATLIGTSISFISRCRQDGITTRAQGRSLNALVALRQPCRGEARPRFLGDRAPYGSQVAKNREHQTGAEEGEGSELVEKGLQRRKSNIACLRSQSGFGGWRGASSKYAAGLFNAKLRGRHET
jgi:hypothetical protein